MREHLYSLLGKVLAFVGVIIVLFPILIFWIIWNNEDYLQLLAILMFIEIASLGIGITTIGVVIHKRFRETEPFLAKEGEPIHSGRVWMKKAESGLFLTSCGLVVSINQESGETAYVGYRLVPAKRATCIDCTQRKGREILDAHSLRRES